MNEMIQSLIEGLREETSCYRELLPLAQRQKDLLVEGAVEALPENVRLEEKLLFSLSPIISRRNELLSKMGKAWGMKGLNLTEALKRAPSEFIEDLKKAVIDLVAAARNLEAVNQGNEKLLNNAMSYTQFTLKLIADGGKKKSFSPSLTNEEKKSSFVNRVV